MSVGGLGRYLFSVGLYLLVAIAACESSTHDEEVCCPAAVRCPAGSINVSDCKTSDCFTVENGCCESMRCVPVTGCNKACFSFETQVDNCDVAVGLNCRTLENCGRLMFCASEPNVCGSSPECDPEDAASENSTCPPDEVCYEVELCGYALTCIDNPPLHDASGGGGNGGTGGNGGSGAGGAGGAG